MTRTGKRREARRAILIAARMCVARGEHELAAKLFATVGIAYVPSVAS